MLKFATTREKILSPANAAAVGRKYRGICDRRYTYRRLRIEFSAAHTLEHEFASLCLRPDEKNKGEFFFCNSEKFAQTFSELPWKNVIFSKHRMIFDHLKSRIRRFERQSTKLEDLFSVYLIERLEKNVCSIWKFFKKCSAGETTESFESKTKKWSNRPLKFVTFLSTRSRRRLDPRISIFQPPNRPTRFPAAKLDKIIYIYTRQGHWTWIFVLQKFFEVCVIPSDLKSHREENGTKIACETLKTRKNRPQRLSRVSSIFQMNKKAILSLN